MIYIFFSLILAALILLSGFLSTSETAFFSISGFTLKAYQGDKDNRKRLIARLLKRPRDLLVTILMLNVFANILVQNTVSGLFGAWSGWIFKVGVPLVLTLIFGEIIPKAIALPNNTKIAYFVAPILAVIAKILTPFRLVLTKLTGILSRYLFFFLKKAKPITSEELEVILENSTQKGLLSADEAELIAGYLELHEASVKEMIRPKEEILFYDINMPIEGLIALFVDRKCTRVPVTNGPLDDVLGIISARSFFFHRQEIDTKEKLRSFLDKPFFVPEGSNAWSVLQQLREKKQSLAMVVDEYGAIAGLVAQEDLIEAVVGEIADLRDTEELYALSGKDIIIVSGKMELSELEEVFGVKFDATHNITTIGGFLTEEMEQIPQAGTQYVKDNLMFYVLEADPNRVTRIYIRKLKSSKKRPANG